MEILFLILLLFLPGALVGAFKVVEIGFGAIGFLITAALTVSILIGGFIFVVVMLLS
jgi:hypothetical protein